MNHDEHPTDSALTQALRDSLSELTVAEQPPLAAIASRGRAHQRRRRAGLAGFAGLCGAAAAAGTALAFSLAGTLGTAPALSAGTSSGSTSTVRTAAFTLTSNTDGTDTLTLTMSQLLDPAQLQRALTQHGVRAVVKVGTYCTSSPAAPDPVTIGVLSVKKRASTPSDLKRGVNRTVTMINPAAIPAGTELFFDYSKRYNTMFFDLIYIKSHSCSSKS